MILDLLGASGGVDDHHKKREQAQDRQKNQDDINDRFINGIPASSFKAFHYALLSNCELKL